MVFAPHRKMSITKVTNAIWYHSMLLVPTAALYVMVRYYRSTAHWVLNVDWFCLMLRVTRLESTYYSSQSCQSSQMSIRPRHKWKVEAKHLLPVWWDCGSLVLHERAREPLGLGFLHRRLNWAVSQRWNVPEIPDRSNLVLHNLC